MKTVVFTFVSVFVAVSSFFVGFVFGSGCMRKLILRKRSSETVVEEGLPTFTDLLEDNDLDFELL